MPGDPGTFIDAIWFELVLYPSAPQANVVGICLGWACGKRLWCGISGNTRWTNPFEPFPKQANVWILCLRVWHILVHFGVGSLGILVG